VRGSAETGKPKPNVSSISVCKACEAIGRTAVRTRSILSRVAQEMEPSACRSATVHLTTSEASRANVSQALGVNFDTLVSAAIAASRPAAISVFFVAQGSDGRYRLYHTVRFSSGSWRPADDVLALNGATLNGTNYEFNVAAGMSPVLGRPQDLELVYVIYDVGTVIEVGRVASTPQQWPGGVQGVYSPLGNISGLWSGRTDPANPWNIHNVVVSSRPFHEWG
jgi:hypothetical protein